MPYTYQPSGANYCFYHEDGYPVCVGDGKKPSQTASRKQKPHGVPILLKIKDKPNPELKKAAAERKKEYDRLYRASKREYKKPRKKTAEELGAFPYSKGAEEKKEKEEKRYEAKLALKEKKAEAKKKLDALKKTNDKLTSIREKKDNKEKALAIAKYESKWDNTDGAKTFKDKMDKVKKQKDSDQKKRQLEKLKDKEKDAEEKHKQMNTKSIKVIEADIKVLEKKELKAIGVGEIKKQKAIQKEKEEDATITIQTAVRRFKAKKKVKEIIEKDTAKKKAKKEKADRFNTKYLEPVKKLLAQGIDINISKYDSYDKKVYKIIDDSVVREIVKNPDYLNAFKGGDGPMVWNYYEGGKSKALSPKEVMRLAKDTLEAAIKEKKEDEEFQKKREEDEKKRQAEIKRVKALSSEEYADEKQKKKMKEIISESEKRLKKLEKRIKKHIEDGNEDRAKDYTKMIKTEKEKLEKLKKL
jgi:hypothetical protein